MHTCGSGDDSRDELKKSGCRENKCTMLIHAFPPRRTTELEGSLHLPPTGTTTKKWHVAQVKCTSHPVPTLPVFAFTKHCCSVQRFSYKRHIGKCNLCTAQSSATCVPCLSSANRVHKTKVMLFVCRLQQKKEGSRGTPYTHNSVLFHNLLFHRCSIASVQLGCLGPTSVDWPPTAKSWLFANNRRLAAKRWRLTTATAAPPAIRA